jgi:hypothetical protein
LLSKQRYIYFIEKHIIILPQKPPWLLKLGARRHGYGLMVRIALNFKLRHYQYFIFCIFILKIPINMRLLLIISIFVISPTITFSQCPHWVGEDYSRSVALAPIVEKYLLFKMSVDNSDSTMITYKDKEGFSMLKISVAQKTQLRGTEVVTVRGNATNVYIEGPADRIDQLINEYFTPLLLPCKPQISSTTISWDPYRISIFDKANYNGIPMKYIYIEKH